MRTIVLALACLASLASAQAPPTLSPAVLQSDFDVLHKALAEAHGGYDRHASRDVIERHFASYRARLNRPMPVGEFAGLLSETVAGLRDGHLQLELDSATSAGLAAARLFPLRVVIEGERVVVQFNDTPADSAIRPGMELVRINGRSAAGLQALLLPKISGDGFIETGKRVRLGRNFPQLHWLYIDRAERFVVTARDASGRELTDTLDGVLTRDRRTNTNPVNAPMLAGLSKIDTTRGNVTLDFHGATARVRVRAFDGATYGAALDSVFKILRERGTTSVILDLRGNGGGVDEYGALLVSYFTDRPFRYFDRIHLTTIAPSFATWLPRTFDRTREGTVKDTAGGFLVLPSLHPGVAEKTPSIRPFLGRVVVLVDGGSFSTTADVAAQLRSMGRATFVGEETAGGYEGNTSGLNADIILPATRLKLRIMMYDYWNAVKRPAQPGRGTIPDHVVPMRVADMLAGRDPALEKALSLLR